MNTQEMIMGQNQQMVQQPIIMPALELGQGEWTSLYLKVLPVDLTFNGKNIDDEASLIEFIECNLALGKVERVDFSERKMNNGNVVKSAYIHFFLWSALNGAQCRDVINNMGSISYSGIVDPFTGGVNNLMGKWYNGVSNKRFITFKKNINPITSTNLNEMNHAQLLRKCEQMEEHNKNLHNKVQEFIKKERSELLKAAQIWKALAQPNVATPTPVTNDDKMSISELDLHEDEDDTVGRTEQWRIDDDEDEMDIEDGEVVE